MFHGVKENQHIITNYINLYNTINGNFRILEWYQYKAISIEYILLFSSYIVLMYGRYLENWAPEMAIDLEMWAKLSTSKSTESLHLINFG